MAGVLTFQQNQVEDLGLTQAGEHRETADQGQVDEDVGVGEEDQAAAPPYQPASSLRTSMMEVPRISAARETVILSSARAR